MEKLLILKTRLIALFVVGFGYGLYSGWLVPDAVCGSSSCVKFLPEIMEICTLNRFHRERSGTISGICFI